MQTLSAHYLLTETFVGRFFWTQ